MPGPRSPYGYDEIFHQLLARILEQNPEQLTLQTDMNPMRARSLFNQFRCSWEKEADKFRKRKDYTTADQMLRNYYALMRFSCTTTIDGLILTNKATTKGVITSYGKVDLLPTPLDVVGLTPDEAAAADRDILRNQDEAAMRALGIKPKEKQEQVTSDNPLPIDTSNKYGIPIGPPPGFPDTK